MACFQRWWRQQSPEVKAKVKELIKSHQLEFINGGMCMHDEATTYYVDMIDQITLGHRFLKDEFGQIPRIGWQVDPYGHSAVQAYLLGAEMGFDSLYFASIDYQDRAKRKHDKTLEVVWRGSKSLGSTSQIFTSIFPKNYYPPDGFRFEVNDMFDPIQDDPLLFDYNVEKRVDDFVAAAISQANITRTNHIMWSMGGDFNYQYAESWFRQMDKFIHYVNSDGRVNALYSTPSIYTNAKHETSESWPLKTGDFFPYANHVNAYWTGYFTSRPSFKRYVRVMSGYYMAARQLEFLQGRNGSTSATDKLADAMAIAQHHDAVAGSERQHVNDDYTMRLHIGYSQVTMDTVTVWDAHGNAVDAQLLPVTDASQRFRNDHVKLYLGEYPGNTIKYWLAFPVSVPPLGFSTYIVSPIEVGVSTTQSSTFTTEGNTMRPIEIGPGNLKLQFSADEGKLVTLYDNTRNLIVTEDEKKAADHVNGNQCGRRSLKLSLRRLQEFSKVSAVVEQSYSYYMSFNGTDEDPQASTAVIFRPDGTAPIKLKPDGEASITAMKGPLLDEVHQQLSRYIRQQGYTRGRNMQRWSLRLGPFLLMMVLGKKLLPRLPQT